jgi:hypothetical protein
MNKLNWKENSGALSGAATPCCGTAPDAQLKCINIYNNYNNKEV